MLCKIIFSKILDLFWKQAFSHKFNLSQITNACITITINGFVIQLWLGNIMIEKIVMSESQKLLHLGENVSRILFFQDHSHVGLILIEPMATVEWTNVI